MSTTLCDTPKTMIRDATHDSSKLMPVTTGVSHEHVFDIDYHGMLLQLIIYEAANPADCRPESHSQDMLCAAPAVS